MTTPKQFERMKQKFIKHQLSLELKTGDMVCPAPENTLPHPVYFHWNKNAKASFPWRVHKVKGITLYLERPSKSGRIRIEPYAIGFWMKVKN